MKEYTQQRRRRTSLISLLLTGLLFLRGAIGVSSAPVATGNPGVVEVGAEELLRYSQVVALSDVHGHLLNTIHLLQKANIVDSNGRWCGGKTLLVVTGDSIDKGPSSLGVLRLWIDLQQQAGKQGGRLLVLLGNHEAEFLADPVGDKKSKELDRQVTEAGLSPVALAHDAVDQKGYRLGQFLNAMPLAARVGNWYFCHAGWIPDPQVTAPGKSTPQACWAEFKRLARLQDYAALTHEEVSAGKPGMFYCVLEKKYVGDESTTAAQDNNAVKWWDDPKEVANLLGRLDRYGLTGVVFGHQPKAFGLKDSVGPYTDPITHKPNYRLIKIDSGMAEAAYDGLKDGETRPYAGHLVDFKDVHIFLASPNELKSVVSLPGLVTIGGNP